MPQDIVVLSGIEGNELRREVCSVLRIPEAQYLLAPFADGEVQVQILDNVRGRDVFIINPTNPPDSNMMEMVLLSRAAVGASAKRVTIIPTYLGYNRQERKDRPRVPISAKAYIEMLKLSYAERAVLFDLHSEATAAHFEPMRFDHLYGSFVGVPYLKSILKRPFIVASPDVGGVARARKYAQHFGMEEFVIFSKHRKEAGKVAADSVQVIGEIGNRDVVFVDDMIDSGGTLIACAKIAKQQGAKNIYAFATHGLFSKGPGIFPTGLFKEIVVTNSINHRSKKLTSGSTKITVRSIAPLIADAIRRLNQDESLSPLFLK